MRHVGTLAERIYDLPLFAPLWIETHMAGVAAAEEAAVMHAPAGELQNWQEAQS